MDTYEANLSHGCAGNGGPIRRAKDIRYYTITMTVRVIASKKHGIAAPTPSILKYIKYCTSLSYSTDGSRSNLGTKFSETCAWDSAAMRRRQKPRGSSSQHWGVSWDKTREKWSAKIYVTGKQKHLGYWITERDAALMFDYTVRSHKLIGVKELNFPDEMGWTPPISSSGTRGDQTLPRRKKSKNASSQYWGVSWDKVRVKWCVKAFYHGKQHHLGYWLDEEDAARMYDYGLRQNNAEDTRLLNFPRDCSWAPPSSVQCATTATASASRAAAPLAASSKRRQRSSGRRVATGASQRKESPVTVVALAAEANGAPSERERRRRASSAIAPLQRPSAAASAAAAAAAAAASEMARATEIARTRKRARRESAAAQKRLLLDATRRKKRRHKRASRHRSSSSSSSSSSSAAAAVSSSSLPLPSSSSSSPVSSSAALRPVRAVRRRFDPSLEAMRPQWKRSAAKATAEVPPSRDVALYHRSAYSNGELITTAVYNEPRRKFKIDWSL